MNGQSLTAASIYRVGQHTLLNRHSTALHLAVLKHKFNYSEAIQHNLINALKKNLLSVAKFI